MPVASSRRVRWCPRACRCRRARWSWGCPDGSSGRLDAALAQRIAETWSHYVEQARAHKEGRYPLVRAARRYVEAVACTISSVCTSAAARSHCQYRFRHLPSPRLSTNPQSAHDPVKFCDVGTGIARCFAHFSCYCARYRLGLPCPSAFAVGSSDGGASGAVQVPRSQAAELAAVPAAQSTALPFQSKR